MFDLESQIRAWRADLAAAMGNVPEPLVDELESHLRDDIDRRIQLGADAQSAFEAARAQLGEAGRLAQEFAKTSDRRWIPGWIAIGTVAAAVLLAAIREAAGASSGKVQPLLAWHVIAVVGGYVAMLAVGMLAAWSVFSSTILRRSAARTRALQPVALKLSIAATIMTTIGVVLGAFWAREHLGRYWAFDLKETGGVAVIVWSILLVAMAVHAARRPSRMTGLLLASLAGNIVVSLSWFGPGLTSGGSTFAPIRGPLLATFVLLQLVLMAWQAMRGRAAIKG
jgi:hypothetical protein